MSQTNDSFVPTPESMLDIFVSWYNINVADFDIPEISKDEAYVVWFCYTVGNAKALISTTRLDHMYYEITYHLNKHTVYIDQYLKVRHRAIQTE